MEKSLESFVEISRAINSVLDLDQLLETIMDKAIASIGVERGIIFLKSADGLLKARVVRNVEKETVVDAEKISRSVIIQVAESGKYFLSSNLLDGPDSEKRPSVKVYNILSVLCVPLIDKDTIIGTIYLDSRKTSHVFTRDDLQFLQALANLAAIAIDNATIFKATKDEAHYWKQEASERSGFGSIVYSSDKIEDVCRRARSVADANVSVLITGESGTGKELVARAIHYHSPRRNKKFVPINCSALPEQILETELFGAKKGAYTGAVFDKRGLFEEADGGTLFLDEIADMQPALQAKLLRVLQEGEIRRVGDTQYKFVDVRVISATNKVIDEEMGRDSFREDLYYRLCGVEIKIPPLRERQEDIVPITQFFLKRFTEANNLRLKSISTEALEALQEYSYPGNVRELQNIIQQAVILSGEEIKIQDLNLREIHPVPKDTMDFGDATRDHIIKVLEKVDWNQTKAANLLGLNRTTLQAKMKKLNIQKS